MNQFGHMVANVWIPRVILTEKRAIRLDQEREVGEMLEAVVEADIMQHVTKVRSIAGAQVATAVM